MVITAQDLEFQSTLPQGERHPLLRLTKMFRVFQSTLPQGERHRLSYKPQYAPVHFNPRSHKGSDVITERAFISFTFNFNPRSHKGSDLSKKSPIRDRIISIHAPTRGATVSPLISRMAQAFQSTLPQGERQILQHIR